MKKIYLFTIVTLLSLSVYITGNAQTVGNMWGMTGDGGANGAGAIFKYNPQTITDTVVHSFLTDGEEPNYNNNVIQGTDGNFYGVTEDALGGDGVIFKYTKAGVYSILHVFNGGTNDGEDPYGSLIQANDGNLYGTTEDGGANYDGIIYKLTTSGTFTVLYSFGTNSNDGYDPYAGVIQGKDGNLYGTTYDGGTMNDGTIFKCDLSGNETVLYSFYTNANDGYDIYGGLMQSPQGTLYGLAYEGGANGEGAVFKCDLAGNESVIYSFGTNPSDVAYPYLGTLVESPAGNLYGVAYDEGAHNEGGIFRCDTLGNEKVLYSFYTNSNDGEDAYGTLLLKGDTLYGMTEEGGTNGDGVIFKSDTMGNEKVVYNFGASYTDAEEPYGGNLILGTDGKLYSITERGGTVNDGTFFSCDILGAKDTVLHSFGAVAGGYSPYGSVMQGFDGNFYGTVGRGGDYGYGLVYKLDAKGNYTVLYSFTGNNDGGNPSNNNLVQNKADNCLYGMTNSDGANGDGVIYKITTNGVYKLLYTFSGPDGQSPCGNLVLGANGLFYGMTTYGGLNGDGNIFSVDSTGSTFLDMYDFSGTDGQYPGGSLIQATNGNLYGMTAGGGVSYNGNVFNITTAGVFTDMYDFTGGPDGQYPRGSLIQAANDTLYGMTNSGGANEYGNIFNILTNGTTITDMYDFGNNPNDGAGVDGSLIQATNDTLYGLAGSGGINGDGAIFKCSTNGNYTQLLSFQYTPDATGPENDLLEAMSLKVTATAGCVSTGTATVSVLGSKNYTYSWSPGGSTSSSISGLADGTYVVTVYDATKNITLKDSVQLQSIASAGLPSSTTAQCINTAMTNVTIPTKVATSIGTVTGLPAGVTAAWANDTITISGTPTASGAFAYSIPMLGGCSPVNATGTLNVTPVNVAGVASSTPTVCNGTALTDITHTTTGATGIDTIGSGLPHGVTATWASNTITITGTPTVSGSFNYTIALLGGCGAVNATGTVTVNDLPSIGVQPSLSTQTGCPGFTSTALSVKAAGAGVTYQWYSNTANSNSGGTLINSATSNDYTPVTTAAGALYYYCVVSGTCSPGATSNVSGLVTVNDLPVVSVLATPTNATVCAGGNVTLSGSGTDSYSWSNGLTDGVAFAPSGTFTYTVTGTNTLTTCSNTATQVVTVNSLPTVALSMGSLTFECTGGTAVTLAGGTPTGGVYSGTDVSTGQFNPAATGTYTVTYTYTDGNGCADTADQSIDVSVCTGIAAINSADGITVYPMPNNGNFNISFNGSTYQSLTIYDETGKEVMKQTIDQSKDQLQINMSAYSAGMYYVRLVSANGIVNKKIVLQK